MTDFEIFKQKTDDKFENFDKEISRVMGTVQAIRRTVDLIKTNDLVHQGKDIRELKVNMKWVVKIQWALVSGIVANLIGVIYLILNKIL